MLTLELQKPEFRAAKTARLSCPLGGYQRLIDTDSLFRSEGGLGRQTNLEVEVRR